MFKSYPCGSGHSERFVWLYVANKLNIEALHRGSFSILHCLNIAKDERARLNIFLKSEIIFRIVVKRLFTNFVHVRNHLYWGPGNKKVNFQICLNRMKVHCDSHYHLLYHVINECEELFIIFFGF